MTTLFYFLLPLLLLVVVSPVLADLDYSRIHIVDYFSVPSASGDGNTTGSFFFRGNHPVHKKETISSTSTTTAQYIVNYTEWYSMLASRAAEAHLPFPAPEDLYIVDVNLANIFDHGFLQEEEFFKQNPTKGVFMNWVLLGAVVWPTMYTAAQQEQMIKDGTVWKIDQLVTRIPTFRTMLQQGLAGLPAAPQGKKAVVFYAHCAAGCDRTGEFVAAYRLSYPTHHSALVKPVLNTALQNSNNNNNNYNKNNKNLMLLRGAMTRLRLLQRRRDTTTSHSNNTIVAVYNLDCAECGRCPNYFSSGMIGWYCLTANLYNRSQQEAYTDCTSAYECAPFGKCNATNV